MIKESEASRQRQINEAEGQAQAILAVAEATAEGLRKVAESIGGPGGIEAVQLRVAEKYVEQFGHLAKVNNTVILPATLSDVGGMIAAAMNVLRASDPGHPHASVANTAVAPARPGVPGMPPPRPSGRPLP